MPRLLIFAFLLAALMLIVFFELLTLAFHKLGLSPGAVFLLLIASLVGSHINLPLFELRSGQSAVHDQFHPRGMLQRLLTPAVDRTIIAANIGGCIVPVLFSMYLVISGAAPLFYTACGVATVTIASYALSRPVPGMGIAMPLLAAPVIAALLAVALGGEDRAAMAYVAGTTGTLIGADLLRLRDVCQLGAPVASIGGAGTFDGIFLTGIVAVLLT